MGRGLSNLQKRILDVLKDGKKITREDITPLIYGDSPHTRTQKVDLSKSIRRLDERGLIDRLDQGYHFEDGLNGFRYYQPFNIGLYGCVEIQISERGAAYLRGEKLPPLVTTLKQYPGRCWCGAKLPAPGKDEPVLRHKLLPRDWKIEFIGYHMRNNLGLTI